MARVAVVGGGVAGLAAAWALSRRGREASVFEATPRLGGRLSSVERNAAFFDDGAQFIRTETPAAERVLLHSLPGVRLENIERDVVPFDLAGAVSPGDPVQNAQPKWSHAGGLRRVAEALCADAGARVRLGAPVVALERAADGWRVSMADGSAGGFAAVVMALPGPAAARLLERSRLAPAASGALAAVPYRAILSVAFEPALPVEPPRGAYALVNADRKHAVSWLAFEEAKRGYVPPGRQVIVAQMAHAWSAPRLASSHRGIAQEALREVSGLLGQGIEARWWQVTPWPAALPDATASREAAADGEAMGLFLAGDAFTGGRVHLALEDGLRAGEAAAAYAGAAPE